MLLTCEPYYVSVHNGIQSPNAQLIGTQTISFPLKLPPISCYSLLFSLLPSNHTNYFANLGYTKHIILGSDVDIA